MSQSVGATRAAAAAALVVGCAWTCPATATADSNSDALAKMLSKGYTTSNCKSHDPTDPELQSRGILAAYDCGSLPDGPAKAVYMLFDSSNDAADWFAKLTSTWTVTPCSSDDPHSWHKPNSPDSTAGKLACGNGKVGGSPVAFAWTNDQNHMGALLIGADSKSLYQWWLRNG